MANYVPHWAKGMGIRWVLGKAAFEVKELQMTDQPSETVSLVTLSMARR